VERGERSTEGERKPSNQRLIGQKKRCVRSTSHVGAGNAVKLAVNDGLYSRGYRLVGEVKEKGKS